MKRRRIVKQRKQNNAGSAIVTVLVVVAFMSILATVMLYISGINFQMKATDFRTKESFYQAETSVEELRAQLVKDVEIAFAKAYTATVSEYSGMGDAATRESNYRQHFCDEMNAIWKERCGVTDPDSSVSGDEYFNWGTGIANVINKDAGATVEQTVEGVIKITEADTYREIEVPHSYGFDTSQPGLVIMRGVTFTYDSPQNYTSIITTDFCITIPKINWSGAFDPATPAGTPAPSATPAPTPAVYYFDGNFSSCVTYMNWIKQ